MDPKMKNPIKIHGIVTKVDFIAFLNRSPKLILMCRSMKFGGVFGTLWFPKGKPDKPMTFA